MPPRNVQTRLPGGLGASRVSGLRATLEELSKPAPSYADGDAEDIEDLAALEALSAPAASRRAPAPRAQPQSAMRARAQFDEDMAATGTRYAGVVVSDAKKAASQGAGARRGAREAAAWADDEENDDEEEDDDEEDDDEGDEEDVEFDGDGEENADLGSDDEDDDEEDDDGDDDDDEEDDDDDDGRRGGQATRRAGKGALDDGDSDGASDSADDFAAIAAADASALSRYRSAAHEDAVRGEGVASQVKAIDAALEARIRFQPALRAAHRLPRGAVAVALSEQSASVRGALSALRDEAAALTGELLSVRADLLGRVPAVRKALGVGDDDARARAALLPRVSRKRARADVAASCDELWASIDAGWKAMSGWRDDTLDTWARKLALGLGGSAAKAIKTRSLGVALSTQVADALASGAGERMRLRVRDVGRPLGHAETPPPAGSVDTLLDDETFDDADLYASLLKDFLAGAAARSGASAAALTVTHKHTSRQGVDRRASKSRKLR